MRNVPTKATPLDQYPVEAQREIAELRAREAQLERLERDGHRREFERLQSPLAAINAALARLALARKSVHVVDNG